ncbi:MAG TPA: UDP-N-acetylglucosamine 1-carboxyvinyltransferase [Thermoguttaceae bacterium]|nr:UDP-N-acetylglucosamine 1-carboxyvinyltransferase [Thermoguttaceae bacterium]
MSQLRITGGIPLRGTVRAGGSKNAALPMMAASILADGPVRLEGVPRLADVDTLSLVLAELGVEVVRTPDGGLSLETIDPAPVRAGYELVRRMRASFCVLGPLLARRGKAAVALPGGCALGPRPVDLHLAGLAALGAELSIEHGYVIAHARRLVGTTIKLRGPRGPTVTGTANVMSAAVLAQGQTTILGAAVEPEIVDTGRLLNRMGARITGLGTPVVRIAGVDQLGGATYRVIPDRIEAATLLMAAAITRGSVTVTGIVPDHLRAVLAGLRKAGFRIDVSEDRATLTAAGRARPMHVTARPYPGVPTDVQAQWMALLSLASGPSRVRDRVFPGRLMHVAELNRLGARIDARDGTALVTGVEHLSGTRVTASDLRASAALVLAGLAARGETIVDDAHHLDRGYEQLDRKLVHLEADVERIPSESVEKAAPVD